MRIIAGKKKGLTLSKEIPSCVRPTSDRAKEGLFNLLTQGSWSSHWREGVRFADMCAGVGGVGLEAWSRGARVTFVESQRDAFRTLYKNIQRLGKPENLDCCRSNVFSLPKIDKIHDIVFVDAPYDISIQYSDLLCHWREQGLLAEGSRLILQLDRGSVQQVMIEIAQEVREDMLDSRCYGRGQFVSSVMR